MNRKRGVASNPDDPRKIYENLARGRHSREIAKDYGVSISKIDQGDMENNEGS